MLVLGLVVFMTYCTYAPNIYRASEGISWKIFWIYLDEMHQLQLGTFANK